MEISGSSKLYLENYNVLEQARTEAHRYLERIITRVANEVDEYFKEKDDGVIHFGKYVQKDGGYAEFVFERKEAIPGLDSIDRWKFSLAYRDAMRSERLSSPTKCNVYCFAPKSYGKQNYELNRMNNKLELPNLFRQVEIELLDAPEEEVVTTIKFQLIEFYDQFVKVVAELVKEVGKTY